MTGNCFVREPHGEGSIPASRHLTFSSNYEYQRSRAGKQTRSSACAPPLADLPGARTQLRSQFGNPVRRTAHRRATQPGGGIHRYCPFLSGQDLQSIERSFIS